MTIHFLTCSGFHVIKLCYHDGVSGNRTQKSKGPLTQVVISLLPLFPSIPSNPRKAMLTTSMSRFRTPLTSEKRHCPLLSACFNKQQFDPRASIYTNHSITSASSWGGGGCCVRTSSYGSCEHEEEDERSTYGTPSYRSCTSWPEQPRWARSLLQPS